MANKTEGYIVLHEQGIRVENGLIPKGEVIKLDALASKILLEKKIIKKQGK